MAYVEPPFLSTNIENSKQNKHTGNKEKKMEKLQKKNFK